MTAHGSRVTSGCCSFASPSTPVSRPSSLHFCGVRVIIPNIQMLVGSTIRCGSMRTFLGFVHVIVLETRRRSWSPSRFVAHDPCHESEPGSAIVQVALECSEVSLALHAIAAQPRHPACIVSYHRSLFKSSQACVHGKLSPQSRRSEYVAAAGRSRRSTRKRVRGAAAQYLGHYNVH